MQLDEALAYNAAATRLVLPRNHRAIMHNDFGHVRRTYGDDRAVQCDVIFTFLAQC
jgi:hypothetical protein